MCGYQVASRKGELRARRYVGRMLLIEGGFIFASMISHRELGGNCRF
jgi:hypothetical protein